MKQGSQDQENGNTSGANHAAGPSRAGNRYASDSASSAPRSQNSKSFKTNSYAVPERWRNVLWLCFPFLILALVATGLYQAFVIAYDAKDEAYEREESTELDVQSADAPQRFLELYAAENSNQQGILGFEQQNRVHYTGVLSLDSGRYLFELHAESMKESEINFLSERVSFNLSYDAQGMTFVPQGLKESDADPLLSDLSLKLCFLLGGYVNPINAVIAEPESYLIDKLNRVVWNGEVCLELTVVAADNPDSKSTVYIDESTMKAIGIRCSLFAGEPRLYRFFNRPNDDNSFIPDEIQFTALDGSTVNVQLTNVRFPASLL